MESPVETEIIERRKDRLSKKEDALRKYMTRDG